MKTLFVAPQYANVTLTPGATPRLALMLDNDLCEQAKLRYFHLKPALKARCGTPAAKIRNCIEQADQLLTQLNVGTKKEK